MKRIMVQAGHQRPLQPHHLTQTGAPGEAELVARIQGKLVELLNGDEHFHGVPMPGLIDESVQVDGAIFLHADGAASTAASGYSLGFPVNGDPQHVNRRLANLIAEEIENIPGHPHRRPDNNTADMAQYYGFAHTHTAGPEVLVEHGFVTNPHEHDWMNRHVAQIAQAEFTAMRRCFGLL